MAIKVFNRVGTLYVRLRTREEVRNRGEVHLQAGGRGGMLLTTPNGDPEELVNLWLSSLHQNTPRSEENLKAKKKLHERRNRRGNSYRLRESGRARRAFHILKGDKKGKRG